MDNLTEAIAQYLVFDDEAGKDLVKMILERIPGRVTAEGEGLIAPLPNDPNLFYNGMGEWVEMQSVSSLAKCAITVNITSQPQDGKAYKAGEQVAVTVDVENTGIVLLKDFGIIVAPGRVSGNTTLELQPGDKTQLTGTLDITEDDYGKDIEITATGSNDLITAQGKSEQIVVPEPIESMTLGISITSTPANGSQYRAGETVRFKTTATNDGTLTLRNMRFTFDSFVSVNTSSSYEIKPGTSVEIDGTYQVTEDSYGKNIAFTVDATNGSVTKQAKTANIPMPAPVKSMDVAVVITNTPANGTAYMAGEKVAFKATATNTGTLTLRDLVFSFIPSVTTTASDTYTVAPGSDAVVTGTYAVTENDYSKQMAILATVSNGTFEQSGQSELVAFPTRKESMDVKVTIANTGTGISNAYTTNDPIKFNVTVQNDGNITLNAVDVLASIGTLQEA